MLGKSEEKALKKLRKELRSGLYSFLVLSILEREGELHGYAIRKRLEELSGGKLVPSEGALYDLLKSLKKLGLLQDSWAEAGGRPRKYYSITEMGRSVLAQLREEIRVIESVLEKLEGL
ncbi:transcription regulator, PadR-like family [Thermococcus kodakarensis KOD1]|uniref:Transcription regulator, PadR-like family n=1 Tax=Thermococcus kodakarensis (strain ATCC BAA-918 / JCM 12380 / KOD1) TaxID=69014 RepID=Q5JEU1_THEKO|nr:PadR family transcriptional regulator [Thermococcus kodakarensis]WCN27816.1 PadR family transcriptional regulator [Thermococcus kodakarensis]WCN30112.1 PadR family transcriptional regulator [Thermococcus kodakarensis]BAD86113.1 transcription regulator, PadR-like family [Thermococcus kodakarensis KOD1]